MIFAPAEAGCAVEMVTIDPMDLQAVHEQDVAMLAVHSVVGGSGPPQFSWRWRAATYGARTKVSPVTSS